jgi:hypothetical protein
MDPYMNPFTEQTSSVSAAFTADLLPSHLVKVPDEPWAFWRCICLRGAGFPADLPQLLTAPHAAEAMEHLFSLEMAVAEKINAAVTELRLFLNTTTDEVLRKSLQRALKQLNKGRAPEPGGTRADLLSQEIALLLSQVEEAKAQFTNQFQNDVQDVSVKIRGIAADPQLRQAVLLQNRAAFRRVLHSFAELNGQPAKRGFKERQNEELIASYLQRYCLKNDTIGFFGPVGWARVTDSQSRIEVRPGDSLASKSTVYFENWCIEALAEKMAANMSLRPWIAPRLLPFCRLEGAMLYASGSISALTPVHAAVLQKCTGEHTAREIAQQIIAMPEFGIRTEGQVYGVLQSYLSRGIISWTFEIPFCLHPEKKLRELLNKTGKEDLRCLLLEELDQLDRCREKIGLAIGNPEALDHALGELDATFMRLTGRSPTKAAGAMYASRTLVYQDCQRDVEVEIGPEILAGIGTPLSLLLNSARWFTYQAAAAYRNGLRSIYKELSQKNNDRRVDLLQFWARIEPLIFDPVLRLFNEVLPEFQNRWEAVLQAPWDERRIDYSSAELKPRVESLFAMPRAGWQLARYHSPDVMIAASSVDAIRRGDCMFVLGEIHMASNTIRFSFAVSQHQHPEELFNAIQTDLPESRVVPVPPRHWPRITNRTSLTLVSHRDHYLEVSSAPVAPAPRSRILPISAFAVEDSAEGLVVRSWDGSLKFDAIEFLGELLSSAAIELVKIVRPRPHVPRITIDNLVVVRESWSFPASELAFIHPETEHERFLQAGRWMRQYNLPRFVFVRVSVEVKPFYLDFDSPIYVEIFIKMIRRMLATDTKGKVTLSEMLPTPEQAWLPDGDGQTYTSEFRMVAWDLAENDSL